MIDAASFTTKFLIKLFKASNQGRVKLVIIKSILYFNDLFFLKLRMVMIGRRIQIGVQYSVNIIKVDNTILNFSYNLTMCVCVILKNFGAA